MSEFVNQIRGFPAWRGADILSHADLDLSVLDTLTPFDTRSAEDIARLKELGVIIERGPTPPESQNIVLLDTKAKTNWISVHPHLSGKGNNLLVFYPGSNSRGNVHIGAGRNLLLIGPSFDAKAPQRMEANLIGPHAALVFGRRATAGSLACSIEGPERFVMIGSDSMLSSDVTALATDYHSIISLDTGLLINPPDDILIERHVWIGMQVMLMKGASIGAGSIIGARSTVSSDIPGSSLAVGSPARVVRGAVSWTRRAPSLTIGRKWAQNPGLEFDLAPEAVPA